MDSLLIRLEKAYALLRDRGIVHNQTDFGELIGKTPQQVNDAFKDRPKRCTLGLMKKIAESFPDIIDKNYMLTGEGCVEAIDIKRTRPFVDVPIRAGYPGGLAAAADIDTARRMPLIPYLADYDITLPVEGESMSPILEDGDIMAVRRLDRNDTANIKSDKFYVIDTERDGAVVKRLTPTPEGLLCESVNPKYKPFVIPFADVRSLWVLIGSVRPEY